MSVSLILAFISLVAVWLLGHQFVKYRFAKLKSNLSATYNSAFIAPSQENGAPQLMALCVDLLRKQHCAVPFEELSAQEKKMVLQAHGIEALPNWMSRYAALGLSAANRSLMLQLRQVYVSRPDKPQQHFGAIKRQQQLRSASEG